MLAGGASVQTGDPAQVLYSVFPFNNSQHSHPLIKTAPSLPWQSLRLSTSSHTATCRAYAIQDTESLDVALQHPYN